MSAGFDAGGRLVPVPDGPNAALYRMISASGALHLQRCTSCRRWQHPPRYRCPACGGEPGFEEAAGTGVIHTWTVTHRAIDPAWPVPYASVVVATQEGPRVVGAWEGPIEALGLDLAVQVRVEPAGDEFAFLWWSPAT